MPLVDIVVPAYNQIEVTLKCLESIKRHTDDYRVIFIDNGSDGYYFEVDLQAEMIPHQIITNQENLGFIKATNQGIATSTAPFICLLNNDTEVTEGWLLDMLAAFDEDPAIGLVGPTTIHAPSWQNREKLPPEWIEQGGYRIIPTMLAFFCVIIKREVIEKVGYLSEEYGVGFADDDDYCHRAKLAGYKLALALDVTIPHYHRTTFKAVHGDSYIEMQHKNLAIYKNKFGL